MMPKQPPNPPPSPRQIEMAAAAAAAAKENTAAAPPKATAVEQVVMMMELQINKKTNFGRATPGLDPTSWTLVHRTHLLSRTSIHEPVEEEEVGGHGNPSTKVAPKGIPKEVPKATPQPWAKNGITTIAMTGRLTLQPHPHHHQHSEEKDEAEEGKGRGKAQHHYDEWIATGLRGSVEEVRPLLQWYYPDQYTHHLDEFWYGTYDDQWYVNARNWRWSISRRSTYERG